MGLLTSYMEHRWDKDKDKKSSSSDNGDTPYDDGGDAPAKHSGGKITKSRTYRLLKGERVLSRAQAKRYKRSGKRSSK